MQKRRVGICTEYSANYKQINLALKKVSGKVENGSRNETCYSRCVDAVTSPDQTGVRYREPGATVATAHGPHIYLT